MKEEEIAAVKYLFLLFCVITMGNFWTRNIIKEIAIEFKSVCLLKQIQKKMPKKW